MGTLPTVSGTYPDGIDEADLLPPSVFESEHSVPLFRDVAMAAGVATVDLGRGSIMDDFDGDGLLDIVTSSRHSQEPMRYLHNDGDGTFSDRTAAVGLEDQLGVFNLIQADYDNDGRLDILGLRGAGMGDYGSQRNSLLRQQADGTFRDVTYEAGLADAANPTAAAVWGDYDNDGDLDVYVLNHYETRPTRMPACQLFRNNGDRTFTDVAREAGVRNKRNGLSAGWERQFSPH